MSTANEMLLLRADTLSRMGAVIQRLERNVLPELSDRLFGMQLQVMPDHMKDFMTTKHYSIAKLPGKKRRRNGYYVKVERRPCALVINKSAISLVNPFSMRMDF